MKIQNQVQVLTLKEICRLIDDSLMQLILERLYHKRWIILDGFAIKFRNIKQD